MDAVGGGVGKSLVALLQLGSEPGWFRTAGGRMEFVREVGCREEMASHEGILGSLRPGDFKSHQYVNVDDKRLYRFVIAFNTGDITIRDVE